MVNNVNLGYNQQDFFVETTVSDGYFADALFYFGFNSFGIALLNQGASIIEYSFDGTNVAGNLNPADSSQGIIFDNRPRSKIYLRLATGQSTATQVRVEAWN